MKYSKFVSLDTSSKDSLLSTSVYFASSYHLSPPHEDAYVSHASHDDDWFHLLLLQTQELKTHPPCDHYTSKQCLDKGASTFEVLEEEILPNPPSAFGSVDSSAPFLPHTSELLESHITQITLSMTH